MRHPSKGLIVLVGGPLDGLHYHTSPADTWIALPNNLPIFREIQESNPIQPNECPEKYAKRLVVKAREVLAEFEGIKDPFRHSIYRRIDRSNKFVFIKSLPQKEVVCWRKSLSSQMASR